MWNNKKRAEIEVLATNLSVKLLCVLFRGFCVKSKQFSEIKKKAKVSARSLLVIRNVRDENKYSKIDDLSEWESKKKKVSRPERGLSCCQNSRRIFTCFTLLRLSRLHVTLPLSALFSCLKNSPHLSFSGCSSLPLKKSQESRRFPFLKHCCVCKARRCLKNERK